MTPAGLALWAAGGLAVLFAFPLLAEGADSPCDALAMRAMAGDSSLGGAQGLVKLFGGSVARVAVAAKYPDWPPFLACTVLYWRVRMDPDAMRPAAPMRAPGADLLQTLPQGRTARP